eukprot:1592312-Prymnesium_polylepis.1
MRSLGGRLRRRLWTAAAPCLSSGRDGRCEPTAHLRRRRRRGPTECGASVQPSMSATSASTCRSRERWRVGRVYA